LDYSRNTHQGKTEGCVRCLAFGTFDILHPGHIFFLKEAKKHGDELFVLIARDTTVLKKKGRPPSFFETERKKNIESLGIATKVLLGHETDFLKIPKAISPDIMIFGYDQDISEKKLQKHFPMCKMIRISPHFPEHFKSSKLRKELSSSLSSFFFL
jgi:FAD synthetase